MKPPIQDHRVVFDLRGCGGESARKGYRAFLASNLSPGAFSEEEASIHINGSCRQKMLNACIRKHKRELDRPVFTHFVSHAIVLNERAGIPVLVVPGSLEHVPYIPRSRGRVLGIRTNMAADIDDRAKLHESATGK